MNYIELSKRRLERWFRNICWKLSGADYPFEFAYRYKIEQKNNKDIIPYPTNCKNVLAEFDVDDRHYVIYIKS